MYNILRTSLRGSLKEQRGICDAARPMRMTAHAAVQRFTCEGVEKNMDAFHPAGSTGN